MEQLKSHGGERRLEMLRIIIADESKLADFNEMSEDEFLTEHPDVPIRVYNLTKNTIYKWEGEKMNPKISFQELALRGMVILSKQPHITLEQAKAQVLARKKQ